LSVTGVADERELLPERGSIVLGPSEADDDVWHLTFRDTITGERVRIVLPREQLAEANAEFTGLEHHL
jgi:hypothetical protein